MDTNYWGAVNTLKQALRRKNASDGASAVMISSVASAGGGRGLSTYSASKAAMKAMCRCAAAEYASALGRAFQIVDDILDVTSTFEELGKPIGSDSQQNKSTYVSLLGLERSYEEAEKLTDLALKSLEAFDDNGFMCELTSELLDRRS